jgi:protocatechuate 3,4-dioxygenase alpha subunit
MTRIATPGQTVGPFFGFALPFAGGEHLVPPGHPDAVQLTGRVLDGAGAPVPDALLEIWQADTDGSIVHRPGSVHRDGFTFTGWGRSATDSDGRYRFTTVRPASVAGGVPFIAMTVFARGLLDRLFTRVYLPGTADDALLAALPPERRRTLVAEPDGRRLRFDVRLQGADETVFVRYPGQDA